MRDKLKLIVALSLTALCLVLAMLVPLAFRSNEELPHELSFDLGDRTNLFADYWNGSSRVESQRIEKPSQKDVEDCAKRMEELIAACTLDKAAGKVKPSGSDYIRVSGAAGEIRLCRMWMQYQGDWQNWLDVCFDIDTGDIYYLYISSECLFNGNKYLGAAQDGLDAEKVAKILADRIGYELLYVDWSGDPTDSARAVYAKDGSAVTMHINCIYYEATLIDVKISCS